MSVLLFLTSDHMEKYIETKNYTTLVSIWFVINFVNCFLQIAGEAWIVTICEESKVAKVSIMS
jgi:hypothetical protein